MGGKIAAAEGDSALFIRWDVRVEVSNDLWRASQLRGHQIAALEDCVEQISMTLPDYLTICDADRMKSTL
jgi:hypothetical protein